MTRRLLTLLAAWLFGVSLVVLSDVAYRVDDWRYIVMFIGASVVSVACWELRQR